MNDIAIVGVVCAAVYVVIGALVTLWFSRGLKQATSRRRSR